MQIMVPPDSHTTESILSLFQLVEGERMKRRADPALGQQVQRIKLFQQQRFSHSYQDLLETPRYGQACQFFLYELYGPRDFSQRDAQFERVIPSLVRLFPDDLVHTVALLAKLHAISEQLDTCMGHSLLQNDCRVLDMPAYARAWQSAGHEQWRLSQIEWTLALGTELDRLTRKPLLRQALKWMKTPARKAGLGSLHEVLEKGFDAFKNMGGAEDFLQTVAARETALAESLFQGRSPDWPELVLKPSA